MVNILWIFFFLSPCSVKVPSHRTLSTINFSLIFSWSPSFKVNVNQEKTQLLLFQPLNRISTLFVSGKHCILRNQKSENELTSNNQKSFLFFILIVSHRGFSSIFFSWLNTFSILHRLAKVSFMHKEGTWDLPCFLYLLLMQALRAGYAGPYKLFIKLTMRSGS